jgi:hypothetical protein
LAGGAKTRLGTEQFTRNLGVLGAEGVSPLEVLEAVKTYVGKFDPDPERLLREVIGYTYWSRAAGIAAPNRGPATRAGVLILAWPLHGDPDRYGFTKSSQRSKMRSMRLRDVSSAIASIATTSRLTGGTERGT